MSLINIFTNTEKYWKTVGTSAASVSFWIINHPCFSVKSNDLTIYIYQHVLLSSFIFPLLQLDSKRCLWNMGIQHTWTQSLISINVSYPHIICRSHWSFYQQITMAAYFSITQDCRWDSCMCLILGQMTGFSISGQDISIHQYKNYHWLDTSDTLMAILRYLCG